MNFPLSFYPYRAGNVWQYRDAFNNKVLYTRYNDFDSIGTDGTIYVRGRRIPESPLFEKIDTAYNLYNLLFQPTYPRYKLNADSGQSWQAGLHNNDPVIVTLTGIALGRVFGAPTVVKKFTFEIVPPPPRQRFWLGDDYLASGFGLVGGRYEPGGSTYLSGAIIDSIHWGIIVGVKEQKGLLPEKFDLYQNYPNPFNPTTTINYDVAQKSLISLKVFDLLGREMATLVEDVKEAGLYSVSFQANGLASGVYFYRLETTQTTLAKKMIIQK